MSNLTLQRKIEQLNNTVQTLSDAARSHDLEKQSLLAQKEEEHKQHLVKVDERIRKMLAAKDVELSQVRGVLRIKEAKLKETDEALAQINREIVSVRKR